MGRVNRPPLNTEATDPSSEHHDAERHEWREKAEGQRDAQKRPQNSGTRKKSGYHGHNTRERHRFIKARQTPAAPVQAGDDADPNLQHGGDPTSYRPVCKGGSHRRCPGYDSDKPHHTVCNCAKAHWAKGWKVAGRAPRGHQAPGRCKLTPLAIWCLKHRCSFGAETTFVSGVSLRSPAKSAPSTQVLTSRGPAADGSNGL